MCPNKVSKEKIVLGPQGFGPARNIVAFTGGDIACQAEFYAEVTKKIKKRCENIWVLLESNGYGLTPKNLDLFQKAEIDSYWLDIKAYDDEIYKKLCGVSNKTVLQSVKEISKRNFVLEVLTVYIPDFVEVDQFEKIAHLLCEIDETIPFHILAFFPQYRLKTYRSPTLDEILEAYKVLKEVGLKKIQLGNIGVFAKTEDQIKKLLQVVGKNAF
jgi:pyruvate-formate lyase-activating enzyme